MKPDRVAVGKEIPPFFGTGGSVHRKGLPPPSPAHRRSDGILQYEEVGDVVVMKMGQNHRIQAVRGTHLGQFGQHTAAAVDQDPPPLRLQQISGGGAAGTRKR